MLPVLATLLVCTKLAPLLKVIDPEETVNPFVNDSVCPELKLTVAPVTLQLQADKLPVELKVPVLKTMLSVPLFTGGPGGFQKPLLNAFGKTVKTTLAGCVQPEGLLVAVTVMVAVEGVFTKTFATLLPAT